MKKYMVCAILIMINTPVYSSDLKSLQDRRFPQGWRVIEDDVISEDALREYAQYRENQMLIASGKQKTPSEQSLDLANVSIPHDQIGKRALVHLTTESESWPHKMARYFALFLRK